MADRVSGDISTWDGVKQLQSKFAFSPQGNRAMAGSRIDNPGSLMYGKKMAPMPELKSNNVGDDAMNVDISRPGVEYK